MRISDWSSDVCSSDLLRGVDGGAEGIDDRPWLGDAACAPAAHPDVVGRRLVEFLDGRRRAARDAGDDRADAEFEILEDADLDLVRAVGGLAGEREANASSEENKSEIQSLMRHSYAVLCFKKKK